MVVRGLQTSAVVVLWPSKVSNAVIATLLANSSLDVFEFSSFKAAGAILSSSAKIFEETVQTMSMTKLFRVVSKLLSFCFTICFTVVSAMRLKRLRRGGFWLKRARCFGLIERIRKGAKVVTIAMFIACVLIAIVASF